MSEARRSLAAYLLAIVATTAILTFVLALWKADLRVPFEDAGDALWMQLLSKGVAEHSWYLHNDSVGAPGGLDSHDFPFSDSLLILILKGFCRVASDWAVGLNLYYLSTYLFATISALFVFRRFAVPRGPAIVGALLFSFLPFHMIRGVRHIFLSSYYLVPLAVMVVLWTLRNQEGLDRRRIIGGALIALAVGSSGVYYAFFTAFFLGVAGCYAAWSRGSIRPFGTACLFIGAITLSVVGNLLPKVVYDLRHGPNSGAVVRTLDDVEALSLKVAPILLPVEGHRLAPLARLRERYDASESGKSIFGNHASVLGVVGSVGFLILIGSMFLRSRSNSPSLRDSLAILNAAGLLFATTGGFGMLFGLLVSPWIRAYHRISVFNAFFSLFAVVLALGWVVRFARPGWPRGLVHLGLGAVLALGVLDQTTPGMVPDHEGLARIYRADAGYIARIEATMPPRSMIFQLPMTEFPEEPSSGRIKGYESIRPSLHSKTLRWSFPTVKGRYASAWQEGIAELPPESMVERLAYAGFGGIYIDRFGYKDDAAALESELRQVLGVEPIVSDNRRYAFFNLESYTADLSRGQTPVELAVRRNAALRPVVALWRKGFYAREPGTDGHSWRWCDGYGELILTNPSRRPRRVELKMKLATLPWSPMRVCFECPDGGKVYPVDAQGVEVSQTLVVPLGKTTLRFGSAGVTTTAPGDTRTLAFRVTHFTLSDPEISGGPRIARRPGVPRL